jgi:hypothetical protein
MTAVTPLRAWAQGEQAKRAVEMAARALREYGIPSMPLKGVELIWRYGRDAARRAMDDADLLVPRGAFQKACSVLDRSGFRRAPGGWSARIFVPPGTEMSLDLHRMVLPPMMGRLTADWLFARGSLDVTCFGTKVVLMRPCDCFVFLLCNFLKDRLPDSKAPILADDLLAVARRTSEEEVRRAASEVGLLGPSGLALAHLLAVHPTPGLSSHADELRPAKTLMRGRMELHERWVLAFRESRPELGYALARAATDSVTRGAASAALSFARAGWQAIIGGPGVAFRR